MELVDFVTALGCEVIAIGRAEQPARPVSHAGDGGRSARKADKDPPVARTLTAPDDVRDDLPPTRPAACRCGAMLGPEARWGRVAGVCAGGGRRPHALPRRNRLRAGRGDGGRCSSPCASRMGIRRPQLSEGRTREILPSSAHTVVLERRSPSPARCCTANRRSCRSTVRSQTYGVAKRDLTPETLDTFGGTQYGVMDRAEVTRAERLPVGLAPARGREARRAR